MNESSPVRDPVADAVAAIKAARASAHPEPDTPEGRREMFRRMEQATAIFSWLAHGTYCHGFFEVIGVATEFINICRDAEADGIAWPHANTHGNVRLPIAAHRLAYLNKKINCMFPGYKLVQVKV